MKINILKQKDFCLLMIGKFVSLVGSQMQSFAFSLYILKNTGSATQFAGVLSISILPQIILGPFAGVFVDWLDRKKIIVSLDILNGILIGIYGGVYYFAGKLSIFNIYVLAIALSMISLIFQPAIATVIPSIMDEKEIADSNVINSSIMSIGELLSPIIAGILYSLVDLQGILIINSLSFLLSALSEMFINIPKNCKKHEKVNFNIFKNDFIEGLKFINSQRILKSTMIMYLVLNFTSAATDELGVAYVLKQILKVSDYHYGLLNSTFALATLLGPFCLEVVKDKISCGRLLYITILFDGIILCILSIVPSAVFMKLFTTNSIPYVIFMIFEFITGLLISVDNIVLSIMLQTKVPLELMGRINTVCIALCMAVMPIGQIVFGFLFDKFPASISYIFAGILSIVTVLLFRNKLLYINESKDTVVSLDNN